MLGAVAFNITVRVVSLAILGATNPVLGSMALSMVIKGSEIHSRVKLSPEEDQDKLPSKIPDFSSRMT